MLKSSNRIGSVQGLATVLIASVGLITSAGCGSHGDDAATATPAAPAAPVAPLQIKKVVKAQPIAAPAPMMNPAYSSGLGTKSK